MRFQKILLLFFCFLLLLSGIGFISWKTKVDQNNEILLAKQNEKKELLQKLEKLTHYQFRKSAVEYSALAKSYTSIREMNLKGLFPELAPPLDMLIAALSQAAISAQKNEMLLTDLFLRAKNIGDLSKENKFRTLDSIAEEWLNEYTEISEFDLENKKRSLEKFILKSQTVIKSITHLTNVQLIGINEQLNAMTDIMSKLQFNQTPEKEILKLKILIENYHSMTSL